MCSGVGSSAGILSKPQHTGVLDEELFFFWHKRQGLLQKKCYKCTQANWPGRGLFKLVPLKFRIEVDYPLVDFLELAVL